jgi:hypothetical protein
MKAIGGAFLAAVLVQPVVLALLTGLLLIISLLGGATLPPGALGRLCSDFLPISLYVVLVATAFVALFGIPLFTLLMRIKKLHWTSISIAGFLA